MAAIAHAEEPSTPRSVAEPVAPSARIDALDALRGLALFGVLAVNLLNEFRVSIFTQFLPGAGASSTLDRAVETFMTVFLASKALALFSLLFGIGLAIQFDRLAQNDRRLMLLIRRLLVLMIIGLVHLFLVWNGDILTEYALAGLIALPFLYGPRWLPLAASAVFVVIYLALPLLPPLLPFPDRDWIVGHIAAAHSAYGAGGYSEVLAFRIAEIPSFLPLHVFVLPRTLALFLLGAFLWRTGVLARAATDRRVLWIGGLIALAIGLAATLAPTLSGWRALGEIGRLAPLVAPILLALGYAATIVAVTNLPVGRRLLGWAEPLGRMAFTNYLLQSVIFGWMFYGYGLGLFDRLGAAAAMAMGLSVYILQALFSRIWLQQFRFGPVEWLWRVLMYGRWQPMRRRPV